MSRLTRILHQSTCCGCPRARPPRLSIGQTHPRSPSRRCNGAISGLNKEEWEILGAFRAGELKRSPGAGRIARQHEEYAEAALRKDARINIRLSSKDLRGLQKKALVGEII